MLPGSSVGRSAKLLISMSYVQVVPGEHNALEWGFSSFGRAIALQAIGEEFESPNLHHTIWSHSIVVNIGACHASVGSSILPGTAKSIPIA